MGTTTGPANLEADWTANTINLEWYNEDTKLTVPTTSNTCTYDGQIRLPSTNPTKTGYTFRGWQVRVAQCNLKDLPWGYTSNYGYKSLLDVPIVGTEKNVEKYNLINPGEFAFDYGTRGVVKGVSRCSTVGSGYSVGQTGNPTNDLNQEGAVNCWCQVTGFDENLDKEYCPVISPSWVFRYGGFSSTEHCASACFQTCAINNDNFRFRVGLFRRDEYVETCSSLTDANKCKASYNIETINSCVWSESDSACYESQVDSCEEIEDEFRCNSSYVDREYSCQWNGDYCEEYYDD